MAEDTTTGAEEEGADLADEYQVTLPEGRPNYCSADDCKWAAWRLYAEGNFAFSQLSRIVNEKYHSGHEKCPEGPHGPQWAQRAVDYCGKATREALDRGGDVSLGILLQGYQADLQAQLGFAVGAMQNFKIKTEEYGENGKRTQTTESVVQAPDNGLRSLARQRVTEIREKQAAAIGVVTERKGLEVSGGIWWEGIDAAQSAAEDNGSEPAE